MSLLVSVSLNFFLYLIFIIFVINFVDPYVEISAAPGSGLLR
jgi:hypothetical protein